MQKEAINRTPENLTKLELLVGELLEVNLFALGKNALTRLPKILLTELNKNSSTSGLNRPYKTNCATSNAIKMEITVSMLYHLASSLWTRPNVIHMHCFQASFGMALHLF